MPYVLLGLAVFGLVTSTVFAGIVLWAVPGYLRERRLALAALASRPGFTPPLSLFKPLHGADPGLEAYLESFFTQDYPDYEILFCARNANDAGLATARRVAARHPHIPVQIPFHRRPARLHQRQSHLHGKDGRATPRTRSLVISDSDVRVTPDYLARRGAPLCRSSASAACVASIAASQLKAASGRGLKRSACPSKCRRRARRARDGRDAVHARPHDGLSPRDHPPHGRLQSHRRLLRRRFHPRQRDLQAGPDGRPQSPRHRPHGSALEASPARSSTRFAG